MGKDSSQRVRTDGISFALSNRSSNSRFIRFTSSSWFIVKFIFDREALVPLCPKK